MLITFSWIDQILIYVIFATSLNLLVGYVGVFAVAPAAFGAFGAFSVAYLAMHFGFGLLPGVIVGCAIAALVAFLMGIPALRLNLAWVILLTLGVQEVVTGIFSSVNAFGGGYGIEISSISFLGQDLSTTTGLFPLLIVLATICFALCWRMGESPYGRICRGIRDDEVAVRSLGGNVFRYKFTVLVLTAIITAVAGAMLGLLNGVAQPSLFAFSASIAMISMVIIGGRGSLVGTVLAAVVITLLTPFLQHVVNVKLQTAALWQAFLYGAALVVVIYVRPQGIIPEGVVPSRRVGARGRGGGRRVVAGVPSRAAVGVASGGSADVSVGSVSSGPVVGAGRPAYPARPVNDVGGVSGGSGGMDVVVRAEDLLKSFGGLRAVDGLSFELRRGAITALVGPNGAGKTTVFNLLTGFIRPDAGRVWLNGEDVTGWRPDLVAQKGMVRSFQDVKLFADLSAYENVMLGLQGHVGEEARALFLHPRRVTRDERKAREKALEWLDFVGMADFADTSARSLGFGQQKLVAIARILATEADVLLLDEPASGIDHAWVDATLDLIGQVRSAGRTICIVEHNLHVVGRLADHVYFMELGRVTAEGGLADLTADPRLAEAYFGTD